MIREPQLFISGQSRMDLYWDMMPRIDRPPYSTVPAPFGFAMAGAAVVVAMRLLADRLRHDPATRGLWMML